MVRRMMSHLRVMSKQFVYLIIFISLGDELTRLWSMLLLYVLVTMKYYTFTSVLFSLFFIFGKVRLHDSNRSLLSVSTGHRFSQSF